MATPLGQVVPPAGNTYIDGLLQGSKWSSGALTYSLWNWPEVDYWTPSGKAIFAAALDIFEMYANLDFSFVETNGQPNLSTDIEAILTGDALGYYYGALGMAVFPDPAFGNAVLASEGLSRGDWPNVEGAIFYDSYQSPFVSYTNLGGYGFFAVIHEIGHALGLKHPHDDGGSGKPTFSQLGMSGYDNQLATIMSYNTIPGATYGRGNPATPMVLDVLALQYLYGANMSWQTGNDTYHLSDDGIFETLWDAGGIDTFNATSVSGSVHIDLIPGNYSRIGNTWGAIAYGATIENAIAGNGADKLQGNNADNTLYGSGNGDLLRGGGGNDVLIGGNGIVDANDGNDVIHGDEGSDTIYCNAGNDTVYGGLAQADPTDSADIIYGGKGSDAIYGNAGNDSLFGGGSSVDPMDTGDVIYAGYGADSVLGNGGDDSLYGGGSVADPSDLGDTINGGAGNDQIFGNGGADNLNGAEGNDSLHGGVGDDLYVFDSGSGIDTVLHFEGSNAAGGDLLLIHGNINGSGIASSSDILSRTSYSDTGAVIDFGAGNSILILGIFALSVDDFSIWN